MNDETTVNRLLINNDGAENDGPIATKVFELLKQCQPGEKLTLLFCLSSSVFLATLRFKRGKKHSPYLDLLSRRSRC